MKGVTWIKLGVKRGVVLVKGPLLSGLAESFVLMERLSFASRPGRAFRLVRFH
jgi:hypothetical protein